MTTPDNKGSDIFKAAVKSGDLFISKENEALYKLYIDEGLGHARKGNKRGRHQYMKVTVGSLMTSSVYVCHGRFIINWSPFLAYVRNRYGPI